MQFDYTAAERALAVAAGEESVAAVWDHPAYEIAREQAALLGSEFTRADMRRALAGERTAFGRVKNLTERRDGIRRLLDHVRSREAAWTEQIERALARVVPDPDCSDLTVYLAIGGQLGIGLEDGAYLNLNEPLVLDHPRQLLYTAIHETSHVCYEREHGARAALGPDPLGDPARQRTVFETVVHTEAYATYAPLALRRSDGNVGTHDHPTCEDYRVLSDDERMRDLVADYDELRDRLRDGSVPRETLVDRLFGEPRLPYRVGCVVLDEIEAELGLDAVREGFRMESGAFCEEYDRVLDRYRP